MGRLPLNPGGVLGALFAFFAVWFGLNVLSARTGDGYRVPMLIPLFVGGFLGNVLWSALGLNVITRYVDRKLNRLRGIEEVPEDDDEPSALHPDKAARRREIAERWKQGRRLEDD
jgi:hypothetical protein